MVGGYDMREIKPNDLLFRLFYCYKGKEYALRFGRFTIRCSFSNVVNNCKKNIFHESIVDIECNEGGKIKDPFLFYDYLKFHIPKELRVDCVLSLVKLQLINYRLSGLYSDKIKILVDVPFFFVQGNSLENKIFKYIDDMLYDYDIKISNVLFKLESSRIIPINKNFKYIKLLSRYKFYFIFREPSDMAVILGNSMILRPELIKISDEMLSFKNESSVIFDAFPNFNSIDAPVLINFRDEFLLKRLNIIESNLYTSDN